MSPPVVSSSPIVCSLNENPVLCDYLNLMEVVIKEYNYSGKNSSFDIISSLLDAFLTLFCTIKPPKKNLDNDILKSIAYIESHYNEDIVIKELASSVFLTEDYFIRKFKKNMGISIIQYYILLMGKK